MDLGDTLNFRSDVYDKPVEDGGVLTNAASASLTITLPDGTAVTPTVTNPATGKYAYDYPTSVSGPSGRYVGQWMFSFVGGATTSYVETFDVGGSLVTVDEALAHLRAAGVITTEPDLDYLQWLTFVATDAVERDLGRDYTRKTIVERHNGGCRTISLRRSPVISITSLVESGTTVTDYIADDFGSVWRNAWGWFTYGVQNVTVTYTVGSLNPPRCVRYAALGIVQGMWQETQQAFHPGVEAMDGLSGIALAAPSNTVAEVQRAYNSLRSSGVA